MAFHPLKRGDVGIRARSLRHRRYALPLTRFQAVPRNRLLATCIANCLTVDGREGAKGEATNRNRSRQPCMIAPINWRASTLLSIPNRCPKARKNCPIAVCLLPSKVVPGTMPQPGNCASLHHRRSGAYRPANYRCGSFPEVATSGNWRKWQPIVCSRIKATAPP